MYLFAGTFLLTAFGFAKLYQRPFTWAFIRTDSMSIWKENFASALYEIGVTHIALVLFIASLIAYAARSRGPVRLPRLSLGLSVAGIAFSILLQPTPPGLLSNPISAAFAAKPKPVLQTNPDIAENDLIPALDSPEPAPFSRGAAIERVRRRNVILYFLESTPASAVGKIVQGKEVTPNLNRLKEKSLYFNRHYANFPLSINAFYNAFCGAYALPDGAWISLALPDFPVPCLSQILKKQQYRTIALHAGYLGYAKQKRFMQSRGFDLMIDAENIKQPPYEKGMGPWGAADERAMIRPLSEFAVADKVNPFLAVLFAFAPHHPYNMPDDFPQLVTQDETLKKSQRNFFNSLHFSDHAFGEIFAQLEKNGVLKDSILIVFGDHGEAFYEHRGNYNHPFFLYEENVHVPFFIYYDGIKPQEISHVTSHVDILPTVLDLLDLKHQQHPMHVGRSMLSDGGQRVAHLQTYWQEEFSGIVDQRFKFIRKETGAEELFDLSEDAGEQKNIAGSNPEILRSYQNLTQKAFAQKKAYYKKYGNYELTRFKPSTQDK